MRISAPGDGTTPALTDAVPSTRRSPAPTADGERRRPVITIVIPTLGRPRFLQRSLAAICRCRCERGDIEVIVVDDGPSIGTQAIVAAWVAKYIGSGITLRYEANNGTRGPAAARNLGWRAARGYLIGFTDDDTEPAPDWIDKGVRAFDGDIDAAWGRIVMPIPPVPTDYELDAHGLEHAVFVTANCFCRRDMLVRLDGFDENFRTAWREDADFYFRLLRTGARIAHIPDAVVIHPVRPAPWGISLRQQKKVLFDALLYKKHPALYRERIRATPRYDYYAIVGALLLALAGAGFSLPQLTAAAGSVWMAMTAWLCGKRLLHTSKAPAHVAEMLITSVIIPPLALFWRFYGAFKYRTLFL